MADCIACHTSITSASPVAEKLLLGEVKLAMPEWASQGRVVNLYLVLLLIADGIYTQTFQIHYICNRGSDAAGPQPLPSTFTAALLPLHCKRWETYHSPRLLLSLPPDLASGSATTTPAAGNELSQKKFRN